MAANTTSLSLDLNVDPYYDDFDESKNFHRILYKPGLAVQARELTQQQSILQNQIDRFAEHIFEEGSIVSGCELNFEKRLAYAKIEDVYKDGTNVEVNDLVGKTLTCITSANSSVGLNAFVLEVADGSEAAAPDTKTIFLKYLNSADDTTTRKFDKADILQIDGTTDCVTVINDGTAIGQGTRVLLGRGILFAKDHFIRVDEQSIVAGKYDSGNTSARVGYRIEESIVSINEDLSLLDPATGARNYAAPGADRLKLTANIVSYSTGETPPDDFIEIVRIRNGAPEFKADKPIYSDINDYIARRTFDESGNYLVNGLTTSLREHLKVGDNQGLYTVGEGGNNSLLVVDVAPGKAYVNGYELETLVTQHVEIDKGIDTENVESLSVAANYGNYVTVDELSGPWDLKEHTTVNLYNTAQNAVSNGTFSSVGAVGTSIGTARVRAIEHSAGEQGASSTSYRLYLYDVIMTANSFADVRSVSKPTGGSIVSHADVVLDAQTNTAIIQESSFNSTLFKIPATGIRTIRDAINDIDTTFKFITTFDNESINSGGTLTISGSSFENWPFSVGALNNTQIDENFVVTVRATADSVANTFTGVSRTGTALTMASTTGVSVGDIIVSFTTEESLVVSVDGPTSATVVVMSGGDFTSTTAWKRFVPGQIINMTGVGTSGTARSITINSATNATIDIKENLQSSLSVDISCYLNRLEAEEAKKVKRPDRFVRFDLDAVGANTTGPWNLGISDVFALKEVRYKTGGNFTSETEGTDVTQHFTLDNGQRDNFYEHGQLKLKTGSTLSLAPTGDLLVKIDWFGHDYVTGGVGYFSVDSYPIDDVNGAANTIAITTAEIPLYTSPVTGQVFNLRNCIDIRVRKSDTAANTTVVTSSTINPAVSSTVDSPASGMHLIGPNELWTGDLQYYLPRIDRVVMTPQGTYRVIRGVSSLNPQTPPIAADGMTLATVSVPVFPSLPFENANRVNRLDLVAEIRPERTVRYTMKDIGVLKDRIDNLEYYTSLSLLETDTKSLTVSDVAGNERFKNGILVDPFTGHRVGNPADEDYLIAIDPKKHEARPTFKLDDVELGYDATQSSNIENNGKYLMLPILDHSLLISQPYSTGIRNATGLMWSFIGSITLDPETDYWTDTRTRPEVQINFDQNTDAWLLASNMFGTQWDSWQEVWTNTDRSTETVRSGGGTTTTTTTTNSTGLSRTGVRLQVTPGTSTQRLGPSVRNTNIIPFMRARLLNFFACGLKPNTKVYAFFDEVGVSGFCRQTDSNYQNATAFGAGLTVDANGEIYGQFRLPNNDEQRFRVGTLIFKITDNLFGSTNPGQTSTWASTQYSASGLVQEVQDTVISTRFPRVEQVSEFQSRVDTRTNRTSTFTPNPPPPVTRTRATFDNWNDNEANQNNGGGDPIAQTFSISLTGEDSGSKSSPGVFLTRLDLYFQAKDASLPVSVQIREVDPSSQHVTAKILPFGEVVVPSASVNVSSDASALTQVNFPTPVYLKTDTDYAIVIKPVAQSPNYFVWTARLGEVDVTTGTRITKQPHAGVFFASSNDKQWSPIQEEDLKFNLYIADFGTFQSGSAVMTNVQKEYFTVSAETGSLDLVGDTVKGEQVLQFDSVTEFFTSGLNVGDILEGTSANGVVTFVDTDTRVVRVKEYNATFQPSDLVFRFLPGGIPTDTFGRLATGTSAVFIPSGTIDYYDSVTQPSNYLHLTNSTGSWIANTWIIAEDTGRTATIDSIDTLRLDTFKATFSRLDLADTEVTAEGRFARSESAMDTAFSKIEDTVNTTPTSRKYVLSKTNEDSLTPTSRSANVRLNLANRANRRHSPVVDIDRSAIISVENLINNDATGEDGVRGGNAQARYITRIVTLADGQDAEDLNAYLTAYKPSDATINVYCKLLHREDGDTMEDVSWIQMTQETINSLISDDQNKDDFKEYKYVMPDSVMTGGTVDFPIVQYVNSQGVTYEGYKYFMIKIVLLSSNPANVPRVNDFRSIALQA